MSDALRITYRASLSSTPDRACDARARAWAFVFQCWQEKKMAAEPASEPDGHDNAAIVTGKRGVAV